MKKLLLIFILAAKIFLLTNSSIAQTSPYITKISNARLLLTQNQQNMLNRVQSNPIYKNWSWVTLGTITDSQDSTGVLYLTIPGRSGIIKVAPKNITADSIN